MRANYRAIARVVKTHGKRGEVVTVPVHGLPPLLRPALKVAVVPPALKGDRLRVVASASGDGRGQLVRLSGVGGMGDASRLVGKTLLARVDDLPDGFELHDACALLGHSVADERYGDLGRIAEVLVGPANDVWVLDGPYGEVLVPVVDSVVLGMDGGGAIRTRVPNGLVETTERWA